MSLFVRSKDQYVRNYNIVQGYTDSMAKLLSASTGRSLEEAQAYLKSVLGPGGKFELKDPAMKYVGRNKHGDRQIKETTFLRYLKTVQDNQLIMSPSMTTYLPPTQKRSVSAIYIDENIAARNKAKKEMFQADSAGDLAVKEVKDNEQKNKKIKNNALSGAHCSTSTPLFLDTIHSSLTSLCRSATGYGNANNEKLISGNRHYWAPEIVEANIATVVTNTDMVAFDAMMRHWGLVYPTVEQTMACIDYSTSPYWRIPHRRDIIERIVSGLEPVERAAFVYIGDLYHIRQYNSDFMRTFLDALSTYDTIEVTDELVKAELSNLTDEMVFFLGLLCGKVMGGKSLKELPKLDKEAQSLVIGTLQSINKTIETYSDFITEIMISDCMPPSVANLPHVLRRSAVTSDTDSTIFTVQEWLEWYDGKVSSAEKPTNIGHSVAFLASSNITHLLAKMSANIGVAEEHLHRYAMKSEFYFPVFAVTSRAKTYFASKAAQEGQVFKENQLELKGAVMKGSNAPKFIIDGSKQLIEELLEKVGNDELIDIQDVLSRVAALEKVIFDSLAAGDTYYYKSGEIKSPDSYKLDESRSPYFHYLLWQEVFADKYGAVDPPPYAIIKVSIDVNNRTDFNNWLESIEDPAIKEKLVAFLQKHGKNNLTMVNVPKAVAASSGIPIEILNGVATRRIVSNLCEPLYVILESLGFYALDTNQCRLVSDYYIDESKTVQVQ